MFVALGLSAAAPFAYVLIDGSSPYYSDFRGWPMLIGGAIYIIGAGFFVNRYPEKKHPCKFDMCGASHQIFHVCVLVGALTHIYFSFDLYERRHQVECAVTLE